MKKKNLLRNFLLKIYTPKPISYKTPSPTWEGIKSMLRTAGTYTTAIFLGLLVGAFIFFTLIWIYAVIVAINGRYIPLLGKGDNYGFILAGLIIEFIGFGTIIDGNKDKLDYAYKSTILKFKSTSLYKIFDNSVKRYSRFFFNKSILPNIDLIEPGLTGQTTESFPDLVIYSDEHNKTTDHINIVTQRLTSIVILSYSLFIIFLCVLMPIMTILPTAIQEILSIIMLVVLIVSIPLYFILMFHPASLISRRRQAFLNEFKRLRQEEWLRESAEQLIVNSERIIEDYSDRLKELKVALHQEMLNLSQLQMESLITKENIDAMENFISTNPKAALLMFDTQEKRQEKREQERRWKEKAFDILVITIGLGLFVSWLSNALFK